ncbi:MAG: hypothetical protein ACTSQE_00235 [Candidatus Heimdallarchaeaceae archaeon]
MSFYQTVWKDKKNRTALISSIIAMGFLILTIFIASFKTSYVPEWLQWLYTPGEYNVGLTIITFVCLSILYFFTLIAIATITEIRASSPGWGSIVLSAIITFLVGLMVTFIKPEEGERYLNYTAGMRWTIFGCLFGFIILSIVYLFFTETSEEEKKRD